MFDLTTPLGIQSYGLAVPWPREESRLLAPIHPFEIPVSIKDDQLLVS